MWQLQPADCGGRRLGWSAGCCPSWRCVYHQHSVLPKVCFHALVSSFLCKLISVPSIHKFEAMKGLVQPAESVLLMPSQVRSGEIEMSSQSQQRIVQIFFRMIVNANIWIFRLPRCTKMLAEQIPSILSARLGRETPAWLFSDTTGSEWGCMVMKWLHYLFCHDCMSSSMVGGRGEAGEDTSRSRGLVKNWVKFLLDHN